VAAEPSDENALSEREAIILEAAVGWALTATTADRERAGRAATISGALGAALLAAGAIAKIETQPLYIQLCGVAALTFWTLAAVAYSWATAASMLAGRRESKPEAEPSAPAEPGQDEPESEPTMPAERRQGEPEAEASAPIDRSLREPKAALSEEQLFAQIRSERGQIALGIRSGLRLSAVAAMLTLLAIALNVTHDESARATVTLSPDGERAIRDACEVTPAPAAKLIATVNPEQLGAPYVALTFTRGVCRGSQVTVRLRRDGIVALAIED